MSVPGRSGGPSVPWIPTNPGVGIQHSGRLSCVVVLQMCVEEPYRDHCYFDKKPLLVKGLRNCIMFLTWCFLLGRFLLHTLEV